MRCEFRVDALIVTMMMIVILDKVSPYRYLYLSRNACSFSTSIRLHFVKHEHAYCVYTERHLERATSVLPAPFGALARIGRRAAFSFSLQIVEIAASAACMTTTW